MRTERDIDLHTAKRLEALLVLRDERWIPDEVRAGIDADAADDENLVGPAAFLHSHRPRCASGRMSRRPSCCEHHIAELDFAAVMQRFIHRTRLPTRRTHILQRGYIFSHRHGPRAGKLLHEAIAFHVIAMSMAP